MTQDIKDKLLIIVNNLYFDQQELYKTLRKKKIHVPDLLSITDSISRTNKELNQLLVYLNNEDSNKKTYTYYMAHPRSGNVDENLRRASDIAQELSCYFPLIEPFKLIPQDGSVDEFTAMKSCIKFLINANALILTGDWKNSKGCLLEKKIAEAIGLPIYEYKNKLISIVT